MTTLAEVMSAPIGSRLDWLGTANVYYIKRSSDQWRRFSDTEASGSTDYRASAITQHWDLYELTPAERDISKSVAESPELIAFKGHASYVLLEAARRNNWCSVVNREMRNLGLFAPDDFHSLPTPPEDLVKFKEQLREKAVAVAANENVSDKLIYEILAPLGIEKPAKPWKIGDQITQGHLCDLPAGSLLRKPSSDLAVTDGRGRARYVETGFSTETNGYYIILSIPGGSQ